ncbi:hypothetical protein JCM8097_002105 [Rhodosporidiobolus ruineniae]
MSDDPADSPSSPPAPPDLPQGLRQRVARASHDLDDGPPAPPVHQDDATRHQDAEEGPFGKTPDGKVFKIPQTHNMISSLFDPRFPKSNIDLLTLFLLGSQLLLFLVLSRPAARWFFGIYFAFWRLAYDAGLGYVLTKQSKTRWIVRTVARHGWFDSARQPAVARWVRRELGKKMGPAYDFQGVPLEFNVWILFRHSVDVILLNDFLAYVLFSLSFFRLSGPPGHSILFHILRWTGGVVLLLFNLWVKTDAHKIVKDFAWYWGDAFFLSLQNLVFDGVFEFAPHPMYSVGYAGYYGLSLIVASPAVLFVSLAAHAAQFGFLIFFENPHIERTSTPSTKSSSLSRLDLDNKYFQKDLLILKNWDMFRARDLTYLLVLVYAFTSVALSAINTETRIVFLFIHALGWRLFHTGALGWVLIAQSERKWVVRHFLKNYHYEREGDAVLDAFNQWKGIYNLSLSMTYVSFGMLAWSSASILGDWTIGRELVRYTLGLLLVALHLWTASSTFEVLGPFGWFYGDFFIPNEYPHTLYYSGIFRYLNNPERTMGGAAFFGFVLLSGSKLVLAQAVIAIVAHWWFLSAVENPHMQRLYGNTLRKDAGVTKTLRNAVRRVSLSHKDSATGHAEILDRLSRNVREVQGTVEKVLEETAEAVEEFLTRSAPAVKGYVEDTKILLQQTGERFVISRVAHDLDRYDSAQYTLTLTPSRYPLLAPHASTSSAPSLRYHLGEPIDVVWSAPSNHSRKDWIGVYRLGASPALVTKISSQGKWLGVYDDEWDGDRYAEEKASNAATVNPDGTVGGRVIFGDKKLPWKSGRYEFRLHHDGKHSVMACSEPFEIFVDRPEDPNNPQSVHMALTHIVAKALALRPAVIPISARPLLHQDSRAPRPQVCDDVKPSARTTIDGKGKAKAVDEPLPCEGPADGHEDDTVVALVDPDDFVLYSQDEAAHISYAIQVAFDVELDKEVVLAAANVKKLAARIVEARLVLRPGQGGTAMKSDLKEG